MKLKLLFLSCLLLAFMSVAMAQENQDDSLPARISKVNVHAEVVDSVRIAQIHWRISSDDGNGNDNIKEYVILRGAGIKGPFEERGRVPAGRDMFIDTLFRINDLEDSILALSTELAPSPITNLRGHDKDNDHGHAIDLLWDISADDGAGEDNVIAYTIFRADSLPNTFFYRGVVIKGGTSFDDVGSKEHESDSYMPDFYDYYYKVRATTFDYIPGTSDYYYVIRTVANDTSKFQDSNPALCNNSIFTDSEIFGPVQCYGQWFNTARIPVLVFVIGFLLVTIYFIKKARGGAKLFIRRLAGIEAVDEAIGRATEMGKPILYVMGLGVASEIATIASFTILGRVAKKVAEYQTGLIVPCYDPIVMTIAQETVKASYMDANRPDAYTDDMVYFVTQSQFAYVAAVNGTMLRELPATNIYMGKFFAESLILAETGALAGSIQIAGTDEIAQIPFFVVACDYTLIGEELYAASAYLGREPILLGSLKAQDYAKAGVIICALLGFVTINFGWDGLAQLFQVPNSFFANLFGGPN
ncbi:MAG TPA: hypothetical protein ENL22_05175 [candidate division Zixibacteria bacterium]|nr:hypothetical protein [candidate division Zixibacteria bacterium]